MAKTSDRRYKKAVQAASKRSQVEKRTRIRTIRKISRILGVSQNTQISREKTNAVLESTLAYRVECLIQKALDLFEDEAETQRWLSTPKEALGGQTPLEALVSESGCEKVEELLYRAEYGIFG